MVDGWWVDEWTCVGANEGRGGRKVRRARVHYPGTYTHTVVELKFSQPQAPGYNRRCCEVWDSRGESGHAHKHLSFANALGSLA